MQDERTLPVFREALLDPRREVYVQAHQLLENVSGDWQTAKQILADFHDGKVAGEVVEGEPVSALLAIVNSPHAQERMNAIRKLAVARDPRVEVVLELNLTSKDPSVRKEATRALRRRHQEITLPMLFTRLGQSCLDLTRDGHAPVPHPLRLKLEKFRQEHREANRPDPLEAEMGRLLHHAFEDGESFDARLRAICQEIRAAMAQVAGEPLDGANPPATGAAGSAARQRKVIFEKLLLEADSGPETPFEFQETVQESRLSPLKALGAGFAVIWVGTILVAYQFGGKGGRPAQVSTELLSREQTVKSLDEMAMEQDSDQFRQRFWGTRLSFTAHLERIGDDLSMALVRRGSALFKVTPLGLTERLPKGLKRGAVHAVTGAITGLDSDGTISLEGTLQPQTSADAH
jgi:hypothetical protein